MATYKCFKCEKKILSNNLDKRFVCPNCGSKIFYIDNNSSKLLILAVPNEMNAKINMAITRINKINEKITRINSKIRKENMDLYSSRIKDKESNKKKEDIINFINQNLKV